MAEQKDTMTVAEKHSLISRFLTNLLELGGMIKVHDDGLISYASKPDEPIMLKVSGDPEPRPLVVYRTKIEQPKAIVINPFVEPIGKDPTDKLWFYNTTNTVHAVTLTRIIEFLFTNVVKAANGSPVDDPTLIHVLSGLVNSADLKTEKEFAKIVKSLPEFDGELDEQMLNEISLIADHTKPKDFVTISRSKQERKTILTTFLYNQENDLKKKLGTKIRKKTWTLIEKLFKEIYATENIYDPIFTITTEQKRCPTFLTYVKVLINSWNKFIPYLTYLYGEDGAEEQINKIIMLESVMDKLDDLSNVAHWARGCITGKLQLSNGEILEEQESVTLADAPVRKSRARDNDEYIERIKTQVDRAVQADTAERSAMDILEEKNADARYNYAYSNSYRDDRRDDRRYRDYDRRDDRDDRMGGRSAMDILNAEDRYNRGYDRFDRRWDRDDRRDRDDRPYRPMGRRIAFGYR